MLSNFGRWRNRTELGCRGKFRATVACVPRSRLANQLGELIQVDVAVGYDGHNLARAGAACRA